MRLLSPDGIDGGILAECRAEQIKAEIIVACACVRDDATRKSAALITR